MTLTRKTKLPPGQPMKKDLDELLAYTRKSAARSRRQANEAQTLRDTNAYWRRRAPRTKELAKRWEGWAVALEQLMERKP